MKADINAQGPQPQLHGCQDASGRLRMVSCKPGEPRIVWNIAGNAGPQWPAGNQIGGCSHLVERVGCGRRLSASDDPAPGLRDGLPTTATSAAQKYCEYGPTP